MKSFIPAIALFFGMSVVLAVLQLRPDPTSRQVAVLFPPGHSFLASFQDTVRAGGRVVRAGGLDNILIVEMDRPDSFSRMYAHGAVLLFNPRILGYCNTKSL